MAMAFASRVAALSDWNRIEGQAPGRELGLQAMAIWNELIALDMAKTLNDRYLSFRPRGIQRAEAIPFEKTGLKVSTWKARPISFVSRSHSMR